jgi:hypothetical protein
MSIEVFAGVLKRCFESMNEKSYYYHKALYQNSLDVFIQSHQKDSSKYKKPFQRKLLLQSIQEELLVFFIALTLPFEERSAKCLSDLRSPIIYPLCITVFEFELHDWVVRLEPTIEEFLILEDFFKKHPNPLFAMKQMREIELPAYVIPCQKSSSQ